MDLCIFDSKKRKSNAIKWPFVYHKCIIGPRELRNKICCLSLSLAGMKTDNRRIRPHHFLRLVMRRFRRI